MPELSFGLRALSMDRSRAQLLFTDRMEQVLEASSECVTCVDQAWCFTDLNRAARELLQTGDLAGENLWVRYPVNREDPFASRYRRSLDERVACAFEAYAATV